MAGSHRQGTSRTTATAEFTERLRRHDGDRDRDRDRDGDREQHKGHADSSRSRSCRDRDRRWSPRGDVRQTPAADPDGAHRSQAQWLSAAEQRLQQDEAVASNTQAAWNRLAEPAEAKRKRSSSSSGSSSSSSKDSGRDTDDDEIVHFSWTAGQVLNQRYQLLKFLGDGTFGRCVLALDQQHNCQVAIKIIRDVKRYVENAKIEADILKDIRRADPNGASGCSIMFDDFPLDKHYCLVFEPLGVSLYDFLKDNDFRGFWMQDLQSFAKQSMEALSFLHEGLRLTHTDLKPENVLLQSAAPPSASHFPRQGDWQRRRRSSSAAWKDPGPYMRPASSRIKIIDFGNATYDDEHHSSIVNTRQYRGPEVLLSLGWDEKSDLWSIGCILMELYAGEQLFETHEEMEHLALVERIIGPFPEAMLANAPQSVKDRYLAQTSSGKWRLPWPEKSASPTSERHVSSQVPLAMQVLPHHVPFVDFVGRLLRLDASGRPSARRSLQHQLFSSPFED